uniref:Transmembrane protein 241 n=1 Tax=Periophthalmus magnuspinnatus TaxID=409849 RepID=A0A3B4BB26_9GOBI
SNYDYFLMTPRFCFCFLVCSVCIKIHLPHSFPRVTCVFIRWQTLIGAVLLLLCVKLGWLEMSHINRSAALSWLPGSLLFVGNIYSGSRALSRMDIPLFFTFQNSSHVVSYIIARVVHRQVRK